MRVGQFLSRSWEVIKEAGLGYSRHHAAHLSAAMAFYALFAVAPLILIATAVGGLVWGPEAARAELLAQIDVAVGSEARAYIDRLLENWQNVRTGLVATVVGSVTTIYLAFRVFDALREMLNTVWNVRLRSEVSWSELLHSWSRSGLTMFLVAPLFVVSTIMSEVVTRVAPTLERWTGVALDLGTATFVIAAFVLLTAMFAIIFKWLPDAEIHWRDVWFGAVVTALLFSVGRALIALYMAHATTASLFGAAGSLVVLMFWIYYSAQILFFGAEITESYAERFGRGIEPSSSAVSIEDPAPVED